MDEQKTHAGIKIVGIVAICIVLLAAILQQAILPSTNTVTIIGQGRVPVSPDIAVLDLSIATIKAPTADEALNQTTQKVRSVQVVLDQMGIAKDDQQITGYAFNPSFVPVTTNEDGTDKGGNIAGYDGLQKITVKVRGIDKNKDIIDQLIQKVVKEGVNQVGSVSFVYSDIEKVKQQAREKAIENAKSKADSMQKIAGVKIGKITSWYENVIASPGQTYSEGNSSYNSGYVTFTNENSPFSNSTNSQTEVIIEVSVSYSVR